MKLVKRTPGAAVSRLMSDRKKVLEAGPDETLIRLLKELRQDYHNKYILCRYKGSRPVQQNIIYTGSGFYFATGAFLGTTEADAGRVMQQEAWTAMEYEIADAADRVFIITDDTSADDAAQWITDRRLYGNLYLKNPEADILIVSSDINDIFLNVYFDVRSAFENQKCISVKEFCEVLGLS